MLNKLLNKILYYGISKDAGLKDRSKSAVFNSISYLGIIILSFFIVVDILKKDYLLAIPVGATIALIIICLIVVGVSKKLSIGTTFISYLMFVLFLVITYTQGTERAGYFWMMLFPLISIFFLGIIHGSILTLIFGVAMYLLIFKIPGINSVDLIPGMEVRALGTYFGVSVFTASFEVIRIKAFDQLERTTDDLVEKRRQTTMILNNVKQGIFLLNDKLELYDERSTYFNDLFDIKNEKPLFMDLIEDKLPQRDFIATKDYLELFFNKTVNPTLLSSINPIDKVLMNFDANGKVNQVWLEFNFERIKLKNGDIQILGLFKDVTETVILEEQLEKEESESLRNMESLFQIIHVNPELMDEFLKDTNDEINKINETLKTEKDDIPQTINYIFSLVHSIKGNAMLLGLNTVAIKLKDFEDFIKELRETHPTWKELLKLTVNLAELKHDVSEIEDLIEKIISFQKKVGNGVQSKKYIFEESLKKSINRLCLEYGKKAKVDLSTYNPELIPEKYRRLFKDSINQFVRNSIAHGIESPSDRVLKGKDPEGSISISLVESEGKLHFSFKDDGVGLSLDKIKKVALEKKGFTKDKLESLTSSETARLIFHPGFSTSSTVTNLAGQGVGMSVIKNHVDSVGGKLNIKSSSGKFCEFRILLHA